MSSIFSGGSARRAQIADFQYRTAQQAEMDRRIAEGRASALGAIDAGQPQSLAALGAGFDQARNQYGAARDYYQPYADTGLRAFNQYADATGVNGQNGYDRVVGNFRASPGYQYQMDQATDAVARKASATGALGSGNTLSAITDRASNLADQEYGNYLGRLNGVAGTGYQAAGAQAGLTRDIGNSYATQGAAESNLYDTNAARRAGIFGNATNLGVSTMQNTTNQIANGLHEGMMAGQQASQNNWGALFGGLNLAASLLGGGLGGSLTGLGRGLPTMGQGGMGPDIPAEMGGPGGGRNQSLFGLGSMFGRRS